MCGLIGVAGPAALGLNTDYTGPSDLLQKVRHRGPDGEGAWGESSPAGAFLLGHTRLAIQGRGEAAAQPLQVGNVTLTYNGELWDTRGVCLGVSGDTEAVARVLDTFGPEGLSNLTRGMWAMAWHDALHGLIYLARDEFGKVPLYWTTDGESVWWASELGALPRGLRALSVPPGTVLAIDPAQGKVVSGEKYDTPEPSALQIDPTPENVTWLLRQGVRDRLVGDRPIAFMLSGGLDSTFILHLAREESDRDLTAYTAVMDPESADLKAARKVAEHYAVDLVEVPVPAPSRAAIRTAVEVVEVPMKAQVEIALAHLPVMRRMASDGYAVCLSGEAADELFGGYGGMQIKAGKLSDEGYTDLKLAQVSKMARGNFSRVNKVGLRYGVEARLPFMDRDLTYLALYATKEQSPPGKRLLKDAALMAGVPEWVVRRTKQTFQQGVGTDRAVLSVLGGGSPVAAYNSLARDLFGYLPR